MRPIKFRAWHEGSPYPMVLNPLHRCDAGDVLDKKGIYKDWILMQFTGLLDKNGTEIYEGDVLKLNCGAEDGATTRHKITATVEWYVRGFIAVIPDKKVIVKGGSMDGKEVSWREIHSWCGSHHCLTENFISTEVIGDIYSNPELLK